MSAMTAGPCEEGFEEAPRRSSEEGMGGIWAFLGLTDRTGGPDDESDEKLDPSILAAGHFGIYL